MNELYYNFKGFDGTERKFVKYEEDKDKVVVFGCAKGEKDYILEWVEHYLKLGFDKIFIANNDDDQTLLFDVLEKYVNEGKVQIFDCSNLTHFQCEIYSMFLNIGNYKWCAYFDCDEFLELNTCSKDIKEVLEELEGDCICFNWLMFGSNKQLYKFSGGVQERFKYPVSPVSLFKENMFIKTIVKGGEKKGFFTSSHFPTFEGAEYNIGGYYLTDNIYQVTYPLRYKIGYIKHYYTKSFSEFLNKQKRGWADGNDINALENKTHYDLLNHDIEIPQDFYTNNIFNNGNKDMKWEKEITEKYHVILIKLNEEYPNYFAYLMGCINIMSLNSGITYIIPNNIDENIFSILLEYSIKTNNKIVCCEDKNEKYSEIYWKYRKETDDNYFIIWYK